MSQEEIAALVDRCLLIGMPGTTLAEPYRDWLAEGLGGIILFGRNIEDADQLAGLCHRLHTAAGPGLIVAADEEGGDITRLHMRHGSPTPGNLALGAVDDVALTRATARSIGAELVAAGVTLNLAPAVDVNTCPQNPIIGTRSFGADPHLVARHAVAYLAGLADAGITGCAKHFPGHGDTSVDSHLEVPTVTGDLEPHLVPFRAVVEAGIEAIMCAHIRYPALDERPATLSHPILTGLLRERLGFTGAIVTDSLTMKAISQTVGLGEGCVQALAAGADLLCLNADFHGARAARAHVVAAVLDGRLSLARLQQAARRSGALARSRPSGANHATAEGVPPPPQWDGQLGRRLLLVDLARPVPPGPLFVVEVAPPRAGIEPSAASLLSILARREPGTDGLRLYESAQPGPAALDSALQRAAGSTVVLVVADAHRRPEHSELIARARRQHPQVLVVGMGTTADAGLAPGGYIGARSAARVNLEAVADLLLGRV